jgi:hypothetical protein
MYLVTHCHSVEAGQPSNSDLPSILSTSQYSQTQVSSARSANRPPLSKIRLSSPTKTGITIISTHTYILDLSQPLTARHVRTHHVISHLLITQPVPSQPPSFPSFLSLEFSSENEDLHRLPGIAGSLFGLRGWDDGLEARTSLGVIGLLIAGNCGVSLVFSLVDEHGVREGNGYEPPGTWEGWCVGVAGEVAFDDVLEL